MPRRFTNVCRSSSYCAPLGAVHAKATVAIDGSKFKAVNHRDRNFTSGKMKTRWG